MVSPSPPRFVHDAGAATLFKAYAIAWSPLATAYLLVFLIAADLSPVWAGLTALANLAPPFIAGFAVYVVLMRRVFSSRPGEQFAAHVALGAGFTLVWLLGLSLLLGAISAVRGEGWPGLIFFSGQALAWQILQGLTLYCLIAAGSYAIWASRRLAAAAAETLRAPDAAPAFPTQLFLRRDGELAPVAVADIVCIHGADDYCEIVTASRSDLSRLTLNELSRRLGPRTFKRVHRSHIVNVNKIASMETRRGGGYRLIMIDGSVAPASRAGAEALKPDLA